MNSLILFIKFSKSHKINCDTLCLPNFTKCTLPTFLYMNAFKIHELNGCRSYISIKLPLKTLMLFGSSKNQHELLSQCRKNLANNPILESVVIRNCTLFLLGSRWFSESDDCGLGL